MNKISQGWFFITDLHETHGALIVDNSFQELFSKWFKYWFQKLFLEFLVQWLISFEMSAAVNEETIFYSNPNPYEVTIVGFGTI